MEPLRGLLLRLSRTKMGCSSAKARSGSPVITHSENWLWRASMTAEWPAIWVWIKPWNWLTETSTGQNLAKNIEDYVRSGEDCQKNKAS